MAHCDAEALLVTAAAANIPALSGGMYLHGDALAVTLELLAQWLGVLDDAETVLADAAPNGFTSRSEGDYFLILLALLNNVQGSIGTGQTLLDEAAESGFTGRSEGDQAQITIELLRGLAGSTDDAETLLAAATARKFTVPSRGDQLAIACQLLCDAFGGTCDAESLIQEATDEGFVPLSKGDSISVFNQIMCDFVDDPDAADFVTRAGLTNPAQIAAVTQLVLAFKASGVWDKALIIYPFVGGTALAHSQNLKSSSFTITWVGPVIHDSNGIFSNTSGYGRTGFIASANIASINSAFLHAYADDVSSTNNLCPFGALTTGRASLFRTSAGIWIFNGLFNGVINLMGVAGNGGNIIAVRSSGTSQKFYTDIAESAELVQPVTTMTTVEHYVLARNNGGSPINLFQGRVKFASMGNGITEAQKDALMASVIAFQTALGRQV